MGNSRGARSSTALRWRTAGAWFVAAVVTACGGGGDSAAPAPRPNPLPATLTLVVPYPAGGSSDAIARRLAAALASRASGTTVLVENTAGRGGANGAERVATAQADGRTLLLTDQSIATMGTLLRKLTFDPLTAFEYLGLVEETPLLLLGRTTLPVVTYAGLQDWMSLNQGAFTLANAGLGSSSDLCALALRAATGIAPIDVPYGGSALALTDLLAGAVDLDCETLDQTAAYVRAGQVKAFAVTSEARIGVAPVTTLPTLNESGLAGFKVTRWIGLYAPRGTPRVILDALNAALLKVLADPSFVAFELTAGAVVVQDDRRTPSGHSRFVRAQAERWGPLLSARGRYAD